MAGGKVRRDGGFILPGLAAGVGGGLLAGASPLMGAALAGSVILVLLPWNALFALLSFFSITQSAKTGGGGISLNGIVVGGLNFRPAMAIVIPFMIRGYLMTNPAIRNRWKAPEYLLMGYLIAVTWSTFASSPQLTKSLPTLGLIAFGVVAYFAVYVSMSSAERLRTAVNIFLVVVLINALYGIFATFAHLALHTHFGVSVKSNYGPGVFGLSYEHDIFASTCGAGAVMFFALWREPNRIMSSRLAVFGFFVCTVAMLLGLARAAWIGYAVAMLLLIFLTRRSVRARARFGRIGIVLLGSVLVIVATSFLLISTPSGSLTQNTSVLGGIKAKLEVLFNPNSQTGRARVSELHTALADLPQSPLIGLGANTYGMRHPLQPGSNNFIGDMWVRALYEGGIVGLALLLIAVLLILWPNRTLTTTRGSLAPMARALTFGWIVLIIAYAGTDDTLYMWPWIMLGLARAARVLADREARAARLGRMVQRPEVPPGTEVPALNGGGAPISPVAPVGYGAVAVRPVRRPRPGRRGY